jgi:hypothetical protein
MQLFLKLFGHWVQWTYACFDRIVINGYLWFLTREGNIAYFFQEVAGQRKLTREVFRQRSRDYQRWVKAFAEHHSIILKWAPSDVRKEELVAATLARRKAQRAYGVYYILESMEQGWTYRIIDLKYPTADPNYAMVRRYRGRFTYYYFYILDEVAGPMVLRVGSFLPFAVTAYLNGHSFLEQELRRRAITFRKQENSFLSVSDPETLQAVADSLDWKVIQQRLEYWTLILGPKFSKKERAACEGLHRLWAVSQVEYCRNFIFKRAHPIREIFRRCCELSLYLLTADRISQVFGQRLLKRMPGKFLHVVQRLDEARHVFRSYWRHSFLKQYEKWNRFLRLEIVCNELQKDFKLNKGLRYWEPMRERLSGIVDRFVACQAQAFNVHGSFDLLAELAKPVTVGKTRIAGVRLDHTRVMRVLEVLLRGVGGHLRRWSVAELHRHILAAFALTPHTYTLGQLRYDLRKLRAHGIVERIAHTYTYCLSSEGYRQAILLLQLRNRIYGPIAQGTIKNRPDPTYVPDARIERAYHKVDQSINELVDLLAA